MNKLDYILPMLMGVLAFVNFIWMMTIPYYDIALVSLCLSFMSIAMAVIERDKNRH